MLRLKCLRSMGSKQQRISLNSSLLPPYLKCVKKHRRVATMAVLVRHIPW
ncbi:MAG: hypothetical protein ACTS73_09725 [Arsenophonus sp. NEOnobi-MAG3]